MTCVDFCLTWFERIFTNCENTALLASIHFMLLGIPIPAKTFFGSEDAQLSSIQTSHEQALLKQHVPTAKTAKPFVKSGAPPSQPPESSVMSTPAIAKKIRKNLSPGPAESNKDFRGSLSRRLFETPRTPADSMLGIAVSATPLWAPMRRPERSTVGPIALNLPDLPAPSRNRPAASVSTSSTNVSSSTPTRAGSAASSVAATAKPTSAASPKRRPPAAKPTASHATSKHGSSAANLSAAAKKDSTTGPTPKRNASTSAVASSSSSTASQPPSNASISTPAQSGTAKTSRVMPARAAKTRGEKTGVQASQMTPIPASISGGASSSAAASTSASNATSTTTPPITNAPSKTAAPKQAQPPPPAPKARSTSNIADTMQPKGSRTTQAEEEDEFLRPLPTLSFGAQTPLQPSNPTGSSLLSTPTSETTQEGEKERTETAPSEGLKPVFLAPFEVSSGSSSAKSADIVEVGVLSTETIQVREEVSATEAEQIAPSTNTSSQPPEEPEDDEEVWTRGMSELLSLLRQLGEATLQLEQYECTEALRSFSGLSPLVQSSSYVLSSIGRCWYELGEQERARDAFLRVRRLWPCSLLYMALYSNTLWHLRAKSDLNHLANALVTLEPRSAESWCALGNSFSLEGEAMNAINAFSRAVQVNPSYPYTHTLAGHERLEREEFDLALKSFRCAVQLDPRHYRAWYGLGLLYFRKADYEQAKAYFQKALQINPSAPALYTSQGISYFASGEFDPAISCFKRALAANPKHINAKYHLASAHLARAADCQLEQARQLADGPSVYYHNNARLTNPIIKESLEGATQLIAQLSNMIPRCAAIHFLKGRLYRSRSMPTEAEEEFAIARELDPKITEFIDQAIVIYDPPEVA